MIQVESCNPDGTAMIAIPNEGHCSGSCSTCGGCGDQVLKAKAKNPIGAKPGDTVTVSARTGSAILAAAVQYLIPAALFVGGYLFGENLWQSGPLVGVIGVVAGFAMARALNLLFVKKRAAYTITGFVQEPKRGDGEDD